MISDDGTTAQLCDFGLTTFARTYAKESYTWRDNSERWDPPELMEPNMIAPNPAKSSFATDVYSFGLVCTEASVFTIVKNLLTDSRDTDILW